MLKNYGLDGEAPEKKYKAIQTESHYLTMRDGTQIAIDLLLPSDMKKGTRLPVVLTMTRYWRSFELWIPEPPKQAPIAPREPLADDLVLRGFAMIMVDARGSGASTGVSRYPWAPAEIADYGEIVRWAIAQPWCNGKVGAVGISYEGTTALLLTTIGDIVKGVVPQQIEFDVYTDVALPGGLFNEAFIKGWSSGNQYLDKNKVPNWFPIPWFIRWLIKGVRVVDSDRKSRQLLVTAVKEHEANTDVYAAMSQITFRDDPFGNTGVTLDEFSVFTHQRAIESSGAALYTSGSWLDAATADTVVRIFNNFSNPQIAVIGAWNHEKTKHGSPYIKPKQHTLWEGNPTQAEQWATISHFFQQTLNNNQKIAGKTIFYYTLGAEIWQQTNSFPLPNTDMQRWYFHADHQLSRQNPTSELAFDNYQVDFNATTGTNNRWHTELAKPVIYTDRAKADRRLLTYTSLPLEHDIEITGYPIVTLYLSSTEKDGAFFVYLEDVEPSGIVRYITEGMLRGIHRKLSALSPPYVTKQPYRTFKRRDAMPLTEGEIVELCFALLPTSVLIRRTHRIRVAISGADKDTFARIPTEGIPKLQIFRHTQKARSQEAERASSICLPVIRSGRIG